MPQPPLARVLSWLVLGVGVALAGCGDDGGDGHPGDIDASVPPGDACVGLECNLVDCPVGRTTSLSGTVYAPNGTLPLYNAIVYVPNGPIDAFIPGAQCDRCDETLSGSPIAQTTTDTFGQAAFAAGEKGASA